MPRKIIMSGNNAQYFEKRGPGAIADEREIVMDGEHARYEEHAGAAAPQLPLYRTRDEGTRLYEFLVRGGYIANDTDRECWLYAMGCSADQPSDVKPILWLHTREQLRWMIKAFYAGMLDDGTLRLADLNHRARHLFVDKSGKYIDIPKPRKEESTEKDKLEDYIRPISDI